MFFSASLSSYSCAVFGIFGQFRQLQFEGEVCEEHFGACGVCVGERLDCW